MIGSILSLENSFSNALEIWNAELKAEFVDVTRVAAVNAAAREQWEKEKQNRAKGTRG